jgi:hypothetical protein
VNRSVVCLIVLAHLCGVVEARADPTDEESLLAHGSELRRAGRDEEALGVFVRALAVSGSPRARAQVALADQALGRWVDAERDLSVALSAAGDPWIKQHQGTLVSALRLIRTHLATLEVDSNVTGGDLLVNGSSVGSLPLEAPVRVVAGTLTIEASAPGFEPQRRTVIVPPESVAREVLALVKSPILSAREKDIDAPASSDPAAASRTAAWLSVASAAALIAGGTVALVVQNYNAAAWNDDTRCLSTTQTREQLCGSYYSAAKTAEALTYINFGAAGAAVAAATVLFVVSGKSRVPRTSSTGCSVSPFGMVCAASF